MKTTDNRSTAVFLSEGPGHTFRIGERLGKAVRAGDFLALTGELGAGKTVFVQGIARGMEVPEEYAVVSPTFTLIKEYPGKNAVLYHLDVYRLTGSTDLPDMGFDEYFFRDGVTVVEWAEKIADIIPPDAILIAFRYIDELKREIRISSGSESLIRKMEY